MISLKLKLSNSTKRLLSLLLLNAGHMINEVADILQVSSQAIRDWMKNYLLKGIKGLRSGKSPGRPAKLTKTQRKELSKLIESGPEYSGFPGSCWRTPMLQHLIQQKFGVFYNALEI